MAMMGITMTKLYDEFSRTIDKIKLYTFVISKDTL